MATSESSRTGANVSLARMPTLLAGKPRSQMTSATSGAPSRRPPASGFGAPVVSAR